MIDFSTEHPALKDAIVRELEIYFEITKDLRIKYQELPHKVVIDQNYKVGDPYRIPVKPDFTKVPDINARPKPPKTVQSYLEQFCLNLKLDEDNYFQGKVAVTYFAEKTNPLLLIGEIIKL